MPSGSVFAAAGGFAVADVRCPGRCSGFDGPEPMDRHVLVAVRRGAFVRQVDGRDVLLDSTAGYVASPGTLQRFAHPVPGGDVCTAIVLSPGLLARLAGGDPDLDLPALPMDASSDLAVRRITALAAARDPVGSLDEWVVRTVTALLARRAPARIASGRPATEAAQRRLLARAREILVAEPCTALIDLSGQVGCSPHHLSRVFSRFTGSGVSGYRNRIRVGLALDRLAAGETDIAALAHDLGFADHAHLTRTIRAMTGHTPTACRSFLSACGPDAGT